MPEEGDKCLNCVTGKFGYEKVENCSCHINPPCKACVENPLVCLVCGYDPEYSLEEWNNTEAEVHNDLFRSGKIE